MSAFKSYLIRQVEQRNIEVRLNCRAAAALLQELCADTVLLATGATANIPPIPGLEHAVHALAVYDKQVKVGRNVVMIGGGLVGCETALWLRQQGKKVTIVEALDKILAVNGPLCHANKDMLERLVPYRGIQVVAGARVKEYRNGILTADTADGEKSIPCDSVILAVGYREEDSLYRQIEFDVPELYLLGDAKKVSNIMYGIWDAFEVANHI